jgi:ubiquinone/menaquinone biosynthesis C-methylase UbiE
MKSLRIALWLSEVRSHTAQIGSLDTQTASDPRRWKAERFGLPRGRLSPKEHFYMAGEYWDEVAPRWDSMLADSQSWVNHQEQFRRFHWFLKRSLTIGNRTKSYRMLDLGCGTGEAGWPLWKRVSSVTFFDKSIEMLRLARNKWPKGIYVRGDVRTLPFLDGEFDIIVSRGAVLSQMGLGDATLALEACWRVLRPGGSLLFDFATADNDCGGEAIFKQGWNREQMENLIKTRLPSSAILAYDGANLHDMNRILIRKS